MHSYIHTQTHTIYIFKNKDRSGIKIDIPIKHELHWKF